MTLSNNAAKNRLLSSHFVEQAAAIRQICQPLALLQIDDFFYMRVYPDGSLINFSTHIDWALLFFKQLFEHKYEKSVAAAHFFAEDPLLLWQDETRNAIWQEGYTHFNIENGISLLRKTAHYSEHFTYFSKQARQLSPEHFYQCLTALERFADYFRQEAQLLILKAEANKLSIPKFYRALQQTKATERSITEFLRAIEIKAPVLQLQLTNKEAECLYWTAQGKTAEEIGLILGSSKRTVETHLENAKQKMGTRKLSKLIYEATKQGLL